MSVYFTKSVKRVPKIKKNFRSKYYFYISDLGCNLFLQIEGVALRC